MARYEPSDEWLAGLLEAEGSFGHNYAGKPCVQLQMSDKDVVERAAKLMGGRLLGPYTRKARPSHKPMFHAKRVGRPAAEIMRRVWPWMGARRFAKITELLHEPAPLRQEHSVEWLAGLLEGDGSFYAQTSSPWCIKLTLTDKDVVEAAKPLMHGGSVNLMRGGPEHWKPRWTVRTRKPCAEELLITLLPYMNERRTARIQQLLQGAQ